MKKAISVLLAVLMLMATVVVSSSLSTSAQVSADDFDTSIPTYFYDFSQSLYLSVIANVSFTMNDENGYLHLVTTQDDPSITMITPSVPLGDLVYATIGYRLETKSKSCGAEIYYAASNGEELAEQTKMKWTWENDSGDWATQTVYLKQFDEKNDVFLTQFRFDALAAAPYKKLTAGEMIDLSYIAFFATEEEADRFNLDEYRRYLEAVEKSAQETDGETTPRVIEPGDYQQPEPAQIPLSASDFADGSLSMTHNENGTLTISYLLNGTAVSYTVPDTLQYSAGPLVGEDDLGRTLWDMYTEVDPDYTGLTSGGKVKTVDKDTFTVGTAGERTERQIGLFYFLWLGEHGDNGIKNMSQILEQYGADAGKASCSAWGPVFSIHHFAEPLYGYYYSMDTWVMRKHVELLTNAGVDFLYFDTTNNFAYTENVLRLMAILHEFNERGYDAPQVCFYTHTGANERVKTIYTNIYKKGLYPDTWFYWDGKPLIIAPASTNIDNFFTTREPQWPNESQQKNAWPWIDWNWPQKVYKNSQNQPEAVSVSVAQHAGNGCFSESALYGYTGNWGRSFNGTNDLLTADSYKLGLNIQNEFYFAMSTEAPIVLVTGWNEWIAGRQPQIKEGQPIVFIDTFNYEYSRDIEMSRGGYFDNYYMQLISNIRALKGAAPTIVQDSRRPINLTAGFEQWDSVLVTYTDPEGDTVERNCLGFDHQMLTDTTGRNDITELKVTQDTTYLYFYIKTADTIQRPIAGQTSTWMQIYLNTDSNASGWCGYDFILNNAPKSDTVTTLAKYSASEGFGFTDTYDVNYRIYGNEMMFAVPMEYLGITEYDRICIQFKAADSDTLITTMEDFYIVGDAAPLGRPNFVYQNYIPGQTQGNGTPVISVAEKSQMPTELVTGIETGTEADAGTTESEVPETDSSERATEAQSGGCHSALVYGVLPLGLITAWTAYGMKKRKQNQ